MSLKFGEKNVEPPPESFEIADLEDGIEDDVDMRGNGQEGNAIVAIERASSQKILDEAPSSTRVDEMAH